MKKTSLSIITALAISSFIIGCGGGSGNSSNISTSSATIVDSNITGLYYITDSGVSGITENGRFIFKLTDKNVTFKIGDLTIGSFEITKLNPDKIVLVSELFGLDRNNTTDSRLLKTLQFLQSIDSDNNPDNGIDINSTISEAISDYVDNNSSIDKILINNDINTIQNIVEAALQKKFLTQAQAQDNYKTTLKMLNILPFEPFVTTWELNSTDKTITIDTDPNYTYNYTVDWGDGNISENLTKTISHTYDSEGNVTIKITGIFPHFTTDENDTAQLVYVSLGNLEWRSFEYAFRSVKNFELNTSCIPDLINTTNMHGMFAYSSFNQPINDWNVSNVTDMSAMFFFTPFDQNISSWNVSNVTKMNGMFAYTPFNQPINDWNVSNVTDMGAMFAVNTKFNQPLDKWNTSKVTNMEFMFGGANGANTIFDQNISGWNVSNVTDMRFMFFYNSQFNQPLNDWNTSKVTNTAYMFAETLAFNQPLNNWDVSNDINMSFMFYRSFEFNQPLNDWNVSNVTDMSYMFGNSFFDGNISTWDTSNVKNMSHMFYMAYIFNQPLNNWNVSNVTDTSYMFAFNDDNSSGMRFNQPLNDWNVSNDTNMSHMFAYNEEFNQSLDNWDVSNVTDMSYMFYYAVSFTDKNLSDWNVSNVKYYDEFNISTGDNNIWPNFE